MTNQPKKHRTKVKVEIERDPTAGYRTVAWYLGANKNTVQLKGWQVRKRERVQGLASLINDGQLIELEFGVERTAGVRWL